MSAAQKKSASTSGGFHQNGRLFCLGRLAIIDNNEIVVTDLNTEKQTRVTFVDGNYDACHPAIIVAGDVIHVFFLANYSYLRASYDTVSKMLHKATIRPNLMGIQSGHNGYYFHRLGKFIHVEGAPGQDFLFSVDENGLAKRHTLEDGWRIEEFMRCNDSPIVRLTRRDTDTDDGDGIYRLVAINSVFAPERQIVDYSDGGVDVQSVMEMENGIIIVDAVDEDSPPKDIFEGKQHFDDASGDILIHNEIKDHSEEYFHLSEVFTSRIPVAMKIIKSPAREYCDRAPSTPVALLVPSLEQKKAWIEYVSRLLAPTPLPPELCRIVALLML
jgi:hypothetical protein